MNSTAFQMAITLFGGLAVFIYGMNMMSDGLQKAAGDRMRSILSLLTKNAFVGVLAGTVVTAVLQSSSATTVMVIGFVSAGLMTLKQAISIIFGANIGTTVTAQLIAFDIGDYAWLLVVIGFVMSFFFKKENIINIGEILFGFGLLFVGINIMGDTMKPLAASHEFANLMLSVKDSPFIGAAVGAVATAVVQSSSAVIAVIQNLASQAGPDGVTSVVGLAGAIPILCGSNIGTTITAAFAAIGGSTAAKRTALAHTFFNLAGSIVCLILLRPYTQLIMAISPKGAELDVISRQVANAHMCFNIIAVIVFLPFINILVKVVSALVREKVGEEIKDSAAPMFLDFNILDQPVFAIHLACKEITRLGQVAFEMVGESRKAFVDGDADAVKKVFELENIVNKLQATISRYLSSMYNDTLTAHQAKELSGLLHIAGDIEHIGDHCKNIAEFAEEKIRIKYEFSDMAYGEIYESYGQISKMITDTIEMFETRDHNLARLVLEQEEMVNANEVRLRGMHMKRLEMGKCSPEFTVIYTDIIHNIEKMGDSCSNIAEIILADFNNMKGEAI